MAPTRSQFVLVFIVCSAFIVASHCQAVESTAFGLPIKVSQPRAGQIQIFNVIYPPQFGLFNKTTPQTCQHSSNDNWYLIINPTAELAVEAGLGKRLTLQKITENDEQLWQFQQAEEPGLYHIVNKQSGNVLEAPEERFHQVLMRKKSSDPGQQWRLDSHGRLYNGVLNGNLDVRDADFRVGNVLQIVNDNGNAAQVFSLRKPQKKAKMSHHLYAVTVELPEEKVLVDESETIHNFVVDNTTERLYYHETTENSDGYNATVNSYDRETSERLYYHETTENSDGYNATVNSYGREATEDASDYKTAETSYQHETTEYSYDENTESSYNYQTTENSDDSDPWR